jgi:putative peptidoglycan lipid II flippase
VASAQSTQLLARVLALFSIGLLPFCVFQLLLRAFYAMQDTRTPAVINVFAVGLNTAVNFLYYRYLNVEGLALGHATAYTFAALVAVVVLRRRLDGLEERRLAPALAQIVMAGVATGAAAWLVARAVASAVGTAALGGQVLQVGGGLLAGVVTFLGITAALKMPELRLIRFALVERWRGR